MASSNAVFHEYTAAADPSTFMPPVPFRVYPSSLHETGPSGVIAFDNSSALQGDPSVAGPATSPNLLASFVRVLAGEAVTTSVVATSHVFYVIRGAGRTTDDAASSSLEVTWSAGDLFTVPGTAGGGATSLTHAATSDTALYYVSDAPLLRYLGVAPAGAPRFSPTLYPAARLAAELARANSDAGAGSRNRNGVLLGHVDLPTTRTLTPSMWALWNALPARVTQPPHRHNSVALDLCVAAGPNTYTLMADAVDAHGRLVDPIRADWVPGAVFVTPPGMWHSHVNESDVDAIVLPLQDAGLYTHQRTLDIRFVPRGAQA